KRDIKDGQIDSSKKLDPVKESLSNLETEFNSLEEGIENEIEGIQITIAFKYVCLYSALYCLAILLFAGFCEQCHHHSFSNALFIFNSGGLMFGTYCILYERNICRIFDLSFLRTISIFLFFFISSIVCYFLLPSSNCWIGGLTAATFSLVVASFHFIVYTIITLYNAHINGNKMHRH